jgi:hypothetical protein
VNLNPTRFARISDWTAAQPPRPLPRTVAPVPGEFSLDYIRRLADANHLDFLQLAGFLHTPGAPPPDRTFEQARRERLAAAAGQSLARITRLHWPDPGTYSADPTGFRRSLRPACRHCMGRRGLLHPVPCKILDHVTVCRRHQLWIGPGVRTLADQYDLRPFPEYLRAHRRHQRLRQRHYPHQLTSAHRHADTLIRRRIRHHGQWSADQQRRLAHLAPELSPHLTPASGPLVRGDHLHHHAVTVAIYPDVIQAVERSLGSSSATSG